MQHQITRHTGLDNGQDCQGEEKTEDEYEALEFFLLVNLHFKPIVMGFDQKNENTNTGSWIKFLDTVVGALTFRKDEEPTRLKELKVERLFLYTEQGGLGIIRLSLLLTFYLHTF